MKQANVKACVVVALAILAVGLFSSVYLSHGVSTPSFSVGVCLYTCSPSDAQLVVASGAQWIRIDVNGSFSGAVANAKADNLKVLGVLDSAMFNGSSVFTLSDWESNVTSYVSQNSDVDAWEIWNEPVNPNCPLLNLNITGAGSQQNMTTIAQFYYNMSQVAYPIIRQYDPSATILLMGGLNLYSGNDSNLALDEQFANLTASMGIAQWGDAISVHAYPWTSQQPSQDVWGNYSQSLAYYSQVFNNMPIWVTETGQQLALDSQGQIDLDGENITAQYMTDAFQFFQGKVSVVFWYSLWDNPWEVNQTIPQYFGLLNSDGTPRPAYATLQQLTNPTPTPTATITPSPTPTPTITPTPTPTSSPTPTPTATTSPTPTPIPTATPTTTASPTPNPTLTPSPTPTPTPTPTAPSNTPTPSISAAPTENPTPSPTNNSNQTAKSGSSATKVTIELPWFFYLGVGIWVAVGGLAIYILVIKIPRISPKKKNT